MTTSEFAEKIDHTILNADASYAEVRETILFAKEIGAASVCLHPVHVALASALLQDCDTLVCTVVGFPLGANTPESKAAEAANAYALGAREIDMVINIGALKSGDHTKARSDIRGVVDSCPAIIKVILETCYLTPEEISTACRLAEEAGAHFVKTSTGFGPYGARLEDVRLMRQSVSPHLKVKAAGGIANLDEALALLDAGADRLGLSRSAAILADLETRNHAQN